MNDQATKSNTVHFVWKMLKRQVYIYRKIYFIVNLFQRLYEHVCVLIIHLCLLLIIGFIWFDFIKFLFVFFFHFFTYI